MDIVIAAVFSSPVTSLAAVLALLIYLFFQWRPVNDYTRLLADYFVFFTLTILYAPITGLLFSNLIALPVLLLINSSLIKTADSLPSKIFTHQRSLTRVGIALPLIALVIILIALFLGNLSLVIAGSIAMVFLGILAF